MDSYLDFGKATEFVKYNREADNGQIIPESCCILEDNEAAKELFIAKDENCLIAPTSSNSYSNTENCFFTFFEDVKEVLKEVQVRRFSWFEVEVLLLHLAALASRP